MADGNISQLRLDGASTRGAARGGSGAQRKVAKARRRSERWRAWAAVGFWYFAVVLVLAPFHYLRGHPTTPGGVLSYNVYAPTELPVVDREATEKNLAEIIEKTPYIWVRDEEYESRARQRLQAFFNLIRDENPQTKEKLAGVTRQLRDQEIAVDEPTVLQFLDSRLSSLRPPYTLNDVRSHLDQIIKELLDTHVIVSEKAVYQAHHGSKRIRLESSRRSSTTLPAPANVLAWPEELKDYLQKDALERYFPGPELNDLRQAATALLLRVMGPDPPVEYNREEFQRRYTDEYIRQKANPVVNNYAPEELIAQSGEPLTRLQVDALMKLNERNRRFMLIKLFGIMLITAIFFAAIGYYIKRFRRDTPFNASTVTLHVLPPLMALVAGQIMTAFDLNPPWLMIWFPSALVGLLSALLMAPQIAFLLVLVAACLFGVATDQKLEFLIFALFSGFSAVFASARVRARGEVLLVGLQVGVVNAVTLIILNLLDALQVPRPLELLAGLLNGISCAFGALIFLVIFERLFGVVTDLRLLELTGIKHPLIAQFEEKAPGSYQHVLNVTKLAEAAAQAIGANELLVRAGAFFHDIGKMIKPKYFSENQVTLDDKKAHSRLSPYMSTLIIKNHVKEGIELAHRAGLPQKIIDFIPEHHGTGMIRYFYNEALKRYAESGAVDEPREEDFRYPGPKPQSIETAIVLIADSVEAIAASKFTGGQVSEGELRRMVQTAISDKFNDGQFDECDLTLRHLYLMREALVHTLLARYHFRVAYPTPAPPRREPSRDTRETTQPSIAVAGPPSPG